MHKTSTSNYGLNGNQRFDLPNGHSWKSPSALPIHEKRSESGLPKTAASFAMGVLSLIKKRVSRSFSSRQNSTRPMSNSSFITSISTNITFILLCGLWYTTSALSSNTGKAILNEFRYPITLTFVQFGFVAFYCLLLMSPVIRFSKLRSPTKTILRDTIPMGVFQVGGHVFSSMAISRIPVSTVHTIKVRSIASGFVLASLCSIAGFIPPFHRYGLCPSFRRQLFCENVHLTTTTYYWGDAGMLV